MSKILEGGTVVPAEGSLRADVAVEGETIAAVGVALPRDGAEAIDVSGAKLTPGFSDGHTHMDMPFGGTVTADNRDTGTAAALAGGTTMLADFSRQDTDGAGRGGRGLAGQGGDGPDRRRPPRGDHEPQRRREARAAVASGPRRRDREDLHGLQGHAALHRRRDLFEAMQIARDCGLLVLVHADVYGETCGQYFVFSDADLARLGFEGAEYVCSPPLRDPSNRPAPRHGLREATLDAYGADVIPAFR